MDTLICLIALLSMQRLRFIYVLPAEITVNSNGRTSQNTTSANFTDNTTTTVNREARCLLTLRVSCTDSSAPFTVSTDYVNSGGASFTLRLTAFRRVYRVRLTRQPETRIDVRFAGTGKANGGPSEWIVRDTYSGHVDDTPDSHFYGRYGGNGSLEGELEVAGDVFTLSPVPATSCRVPCSPPDFRVRVTVAMVDQATWAYDWQEEETRDRLRYRRNGPPSKAGGRGGDINVVRTGSRNSSGVNSSGDVESVGTSGAASGAASGASNKAGEKGGNRNSAEHRVRRQKRNLYKNRADEAEAVGEDDPVPVHRVCTLSVEVTSNHYADICQGRIELCLNRVLWMVDFANRFYRRVDFDMNGQLDNVGFVLTSFRVLDGPDADAMNSERNAETLLHLFTGIGHPLVCMNVLLVDHALTEGVLGLAFIPSVEYQRDGGVCYGHLRANPNAYNSLLVSERSVEGRLASRHVAITLMHELGHAFGAQHDVLERCTAYRGFGNFVMYNSTMNLFNANVLGFSVCSRMQALDILQRNAVCFEAHETYEFCGDFSVTGDEECDCGLRRLLPGVMRCA